MKVQRRNVILRLPANTLSRSRQLLTLARTVVDKMTGNVNFATPSPTLGDITTAADALAIAIQDNGFKFNRGGKANQNILKARTSDLYLLLVQLAAYVQAISRNGATTPEQYAIAASSGFAAKNTYSKKPLLQTSTYNTPINTRKVAYTSNILKWRKPKGLIKGATVSGYQVFVGSHQIGTTTKGYFEIPLQETTQSINAFTIVPFNRNGTGAPFTIYRRGMSLAPIP